MQLKGNLWTILIGGLIAMGPQIVHIIPQPYSEVATDFLAMAVAAWHLYAPNPTQAASK